MKKVLITLFVFMLVISSGGMVEAFDYGSQFDELIDTGNIEYDVEQGEFKYLLRPLMLDGTDKLENGLDNWFDFGYGIHEDTQLTAYMYFNTKHNTSYYSNRFNVNLKHKFRERNGWSFSGKARFAYKEDSYNIPSIKLYLDKNMNQNLKLHNNLAMYFNESGNIGKYITNGMTYKADPKNTFRLKLVSYTKDDLSDLSHDFAGALNSQLTNKASYTGIVRKYSEQDNIIFETISEYNIKPNLTLFGDVEVNTDHDTTTLSIGGNKKINDELTLKGEYWMDIDSNVNWINVGWNYSF